MVPSWMVNGVRAVTIPNEVRGGLRVLNLKKEMNRERVLAHPSIVRLAGCRRNLTCFAWLQSAVDQGQCWVVGPGGQACLQRACALCCLLTVRLYSKFLPIETLWAAAPTLWVTTKKSSLFSFLGILARNDLLLFTFIRSPCAL